MWLGCLQIVLDKGQEDDWFGADWIRWAVGVLVVAFVLFIVRELKHDKPLVDLRVFRHRNFLFGCILIGLFGGAIYGLITLLPLFYQELLGYTASAAGWAVSPRGIGAIIAMPIIGILTSKLDNRWLIASGFAMFGLSSLWFGQCQPRHFPVVVSVARRAQRIWRGIYLCAPLDDLGGRPGERRDRQRQRPL